MEKAIILIIDDDYINIETLNKLLEETYEILFATNGLNALELIKKLTPDLILLDIVLPEMNGFEICNRLKSNAKTMNIPVLFITGLNDTQAEIQGLKAGGIDYITKPFNPEAVKIRIRNHIELKQIRDKLLEQTEELAKSNFKLHKSEERLSLALSASSEGLWDWNLNTNEVYFSPAWKSMLGYSENELENNFLTWKRLIHPDDLEQALNYLNEFLEKKRIRYESEFRMIHKNGESVIVLSRAIKQFSDQSYKAQRLVGTHVDITKIREVEEQIRKLSVAIEQNPASIVITDIYGNLEYANSKFTEETGYTKEEAKGMNQRFLKSGKTNKSVYKELWETIKSGKIWKGEFINKKKNGDEFTESAIIAPIFDQHGKIINYIAIKNDITEQKNVEFKILEQQKELEKSNRELEFEKKRAEQSKAEIEKLNEFTKIINSKSNISNILKEIYTYIKEKTGFNIVWILLINNKKTDIFSEENLSLFEPNAYFDINFFLRFTKKLNESLGIMHHTFKEQIPFYYPDALIFRKKIINHYNNKEYPIKRTDITIQRKGAFHSFLQLPLILQNDVIGILNLTSQSKNIELHKEEIDKLMRFADQIAGVIHNAHLLKETEIAKREAEIEQKIAELAQMETEQEKEKSEKLLLSILPKKIVEELKEEGSTRPVFYDCASVMFTDFKGFTKIAEYLTPDELIRELDSCFSYFDSLMERYNLEKLKTIGDSYMCAGGIPVVNKTHPVDIVLAALEIQSFMKEMKNIRKKLDTQYWELRLGIHTGPLVAGVIGQKKFSFDVWGDTVNTASRMESSGTPEMVNISSATYDLVKEFFECKYRGKVQAKNKGEVEMYYALGINKELCLGNDRYAPSYKFWILYNRLKNGEPLNPEEVKDRRIGMQDTRSNKKERRRNIRKMSL